MDSLWEDIKHFYFMATNPAYAYSRKMAQMIENSEAYKDQKEAIAKDLLKNSMEEMSLTNKVLFGGLALGVVWIFANKK